MKLVAVDKLLMQVLENVLDSHAKKDIKLILNLIDAFQYVIKVSHIILQPKNVQIIKLTAQPAISTIPLLNYAKS